MAPGQDRRIRIAVRSDRRLFRDALAACLEAQPGYEIVGHAADIDDLLVLCELRHPDVVLVDTGTGLGSGVNRLRECVALCRVVVIYERLSPAELAALWRLGVDTLVPCSHGLDALLVVLRRYLANNQEAGRLTSAAEDGLTEREREIITLVSAGHTVDRIAELLEISTSAVANAKRRLYHKLEVASQSQAVARAAALGIVPRTVPVINGQNGNGHRTNGYHHDHTVAGGLPVPAAGNNGNGANHSPPVGLPVRASGPTVALLRGANGVARQRVAAALLAGGISFAIEAGSRDPAEYDAGSVFVVLVDPAPEDWAQARAAGQPVALVRTEALRRAEVLDALLRGAVAVVPLDRVATDLVPALTLATNGYLAVNAEALLDAVRAPCSVPATGLPELTSRECDILRSIADGHTVRQTARVLGIAEKTVENTQARLFRKLGARNRAGALAAAHAIGLLELITQPRAAPAPPTLGARPALPALTAPVPTG